MNCEIDERVTVLGISEPRNGVQTIALEIPENFELSKLLEIDFSQARCAYCRWAGFRVSVRE